VADLPRVGGWFPQSRWQISTKSVAEFPNCLQVSMKLGCVDWFVPCSWLFFLEQGFETPFDLQWNNTNILWLYTCVYIYIFKYIYNNICIWCYMHQPWCHTHTS
jgi:hypothetical protein